MKKNTLNYTKYLICFFLSALLLLSSSSAFTPNQQYSKISGSNSYVAYSTMSQYSYGGVSFMTLSNTINDYISNNSVTEEVFKNTIAPIEQDYNLFIFSSPTGDNIRWGLAPKNFDLIHYTQSNNYSYLGIIPNSSYTYHDCFFTYVRSWNNTANCYYKLSNNSNVYWQADYIDSIIYSTSSIYDCVYVSYDICYGDGSYWYEVTPPTPPAPSYIPTNEEIADKVQEFYNSDFFQNQSDFKDFFVLYNYNNETFSFIGHNLDTHIGQHIESADYPLNTTGISFWRFYLTDVVTHVWNYFNNYYWLYSTTLSSDTISYDGKGAVTDLLELKFDSNYSTIVYSTTDYPVEIIEWDSNNNESIITRETIPGDYYTYDENLDPTTSEYNPVTNFIKPSSIDTVISNANTEELINIWTENIPDFTELAWLFTCVGFLWGYFGSYILVFCLLLFILHIVRGN